MAEGVGKLKSCVPYRDSRQQSAGHAARLGHAGGIEGFMVHFQQGDMERRQVQAVQRFRPDFFCPRRTKAHNDQKTKGGAEMKVFIVWAFHRAIPLNLETTLSLRP
jgi:hypothetical protein